jgi:hypothetical protein
MNSPVNTIPEHRRIAKDELGHILSVGGASEVLPKCEYEKRVKNPDFLVWEGHAAYVFLDETDLYLSRYNYTTNIEQPYMELRIEHGENPKGAKYAFAVLPYADEARAAEYKKTPDVTIVSNTSSIQAVRENKLNITGYVFYEGGACEYIEVDTGAIVTVKEEGGKLYLTVCDPTQEATEINLKLHRALALLSSDKRLSAENEGDLVKIKVNCEGSMSAPIRAEFKILK